MVRNRTEEQAEKHKVYMRTYNKKINGERKEKRDQKRGYPLPAKKKRKRTLSSSTSSSSSSSSSSSGSPRPTKRLTKSFNTPMTINVGGKLYHSTRSTLENSPFFEGLFRGARSIISLIGEVTLDNQGHYFIDRDPILFAVVLQFLRSGVRVSAATAFTQSTLQAEFLAFGLDTKNVVGPPKMVTQIVSVDVEHFCDTSAKICLVQLAGTDASLRGLFGQDVINWLENENLKNEALSGEEISAIHLVLTPEPEENNDEDPDAHQERVDAHNQRKRVADKLFGPYCSHTMGTVNSRKFLGTINIQAVSTGWTISDTIREMTTGRKMVSRNVIFTRTVEERKKKVHFLIDSDNEREVEKDNWTHCPNCFPGSNKLIGHVGRHVTENHEMHQVNNVMGPPVNVFKF